VVAGDTYNPTINIDGDITINFSSTLVAATSSPFTIAGNWANSGTFTHSSGTTTFDGTATSTLSGATTFYNLSSITPSKVLEFTAGTTATTTVAGTLTLDGGACDTQIKLRSSVVGNYWYLDALASTNVDYVDVQDSDATYSASAITATNSTDSEHNVNWSITSDVCDAGSTLTASGTVYTNEGVTNIGGGKTVRIKVNGTGDFATTTASDGTYYIDTVVINSAGDVVTAYLDGETEDAVTVTRANDTTSNIQGLDLYQDYIIARHEDAGPLTIDNLDQYDQTDDDDILFTANATTDTLTASSTTEFFVWIGKTFSTGGAGGSIYLNDVDINGTFTATSTQTIYASSTWDATGGTFNSASSTVQFTSTVSGKTITVNNNPFWNLTFNGSGGGWTLVDNTTITNDLTMTTGTLSGTNNVTVQGGDATGNGTLNFTGGTFTLDDTGNFQGSTNWTFYNLNLGDGTGVATTTKTGSADTIISNVLTIANNQVLDAGSSLWKMTGAGDPFVVSGTLAPSSSDFWYEVDGNTNVTATTYHNLNLVPNGFSNPVFTLSAGNLSLTGNFNTGSGFYSSSVTADTHDPTIDIDGNFIINVGGNFTASREGEFKVGGNWSNSGAFTHSSGVVTFDATDSGHTIDSGSSDFGALIFNGSGGEWSPLNNTATIIFNLTMTAGTLNNTTGSANITVNGNVTGTAGIIDLTTNTFTQKIGGSSTFGTLSGSTAWTFNNLNFDNPYGSTGTTTTNAGTGAINVNGTTNLGSDSVTGIILENDTNNRAFNLNGNVVIGGRGALLSSGSTPLIIGGNYTNSGIFTHSNGTTTFDGTTQQTLSGSMIGDNAFYGLSITNNFGSDPDTSPSLIFGSAASSTNFYVTTASTKLRFQASTGYTFTNFHLNGQDTGTRVQLRSSTPDTAWKLYVTGTQSVSNTDAKDSDASGGDEIDATNSSNLNSGGNTNWEFGGDYLSFSISDNTIGFAALASG
ncbi:MAG: hypothetical protein KAI72_10040, partial [Candidatus Pacebacteria bacterium]|nr:hypothetical protein [Candidatus Paceibacterota bacterium]